MATSLADQLRRLATPQTSQLVDSNKRPSILFDAKEAANKDRETIYDIGLSGLHELATVNAAFLQFEQTLFDRSAKDLVRSVETSDANRNLDQTIRRFFAHLAPHVLLQSAHKCLEWLIRRFAVHEHNVDDFVLLVLPYHETRIFVRCVQILRIHDPKHRWHWLQVLQRPGIPLSKLVLFNRTATDGHLQKLICRHVLFAVGELDGRAYTLHTLFAFFCTTLLGALEASDSVGERFISNVQPTLLKALVSPVVDLSAAAMMIIGYLFTRAQLSFGFLDALVQRLARIVHPGLQADAVLLMVLCFQHQRETFADVSADVLHAIVGQPWIVPALSGACAAQLHVLPLLVPLLSAALRTVQLKDTAWTKCKAFCETILVDIQFAGSDVEAIIRCILDAYVLREKPDPDVIVIDSDNEDGGDSIQLSAGNADVNSWYSDLLKCLDRQYPTQFEQITREIMKCNVTGSASDGETTDAEATSHAANGGISNGKRKSLQTVLSFLFTASCADDGSNIFENLYHHCTENRVSAMRYLVKNYASLCFSDDSKKLLRDSIAERLSDDSPLVVLEVLRLDIDELTQLLDRSALIDKLRALLTRSLGDERWYAVAKAALQLITDDAVLATGDSVDTIFMSLWPYLWPVRDADRRLFDIVVRSSFAKHVPAFARLAALDAAERYTEAALQRCLTEGQWPGLQRLLPVIQRTVLQKLTRKGVRKPFYALLLLGQVPERCAPELATAIIDTLATLVERLRTRLTSQSPATISDVIRHMLTKNEVPTAVVARALLAIVRRADIDGPLGAYDISEQALADNAQLRVRIAAIRFALDRSYAGKREATAFAPILAELLRRALPRPSDLLEVFANFFVAHRVRTAGISPATQVQAIRVLEQKLPALDGVAEISLQALLKLLTGLSAPSATIRACTLRCLAALQARDELPAALRLLLRKVLAHREELELDETQLQLIVYRVFSKHSNGLQKLLASIFDLVADVSGTGASPLLHSIVLDTFQLINDAGWLKRIAPASLAVLRRATDAWRDRHAGGSALCLLDPYQSAIVRSTLFRLNADTISVLRAADSAAWQFVLGTLQQHHLLLSADQAPATSTANVAIDAFDADTFGRLTPERQSELVRTVVHVSCESQNADVLLAIGKLMRRLPLDLALHLDLFDAMVSVQTDGDAAATKKRKSAAPAVRFASPDIPNTLAWRSGNAFMEFLQSKSDLSNAHTALPALFAVLRRCLQFEDQSLVVYSKQLSLACLLLCCRLAAPDGRPTRDRIPDKVFEIDLVVECIRGTQNPQTHHHALQLLAYSASMVPELVLHNMMNIFTFVGTSVVRRDDAYTYQIIASIISSIIPTLIASKRALIGRPSADADAAEQAAVVPILRVFADIVLDVPEHRRLRLYADLLNTLGAERYVSVFLALLFESHVQSFPKTANTAAAEALQLKRIDIAVELCNQFECGTVLATCTQLIELLHRQPAAIPTGDETHRPDGDGQIFALRNYNDYQLRHFKYIALQFVVHLTERSSAFVVKMAHLSAEQTVELKPRFKQIIVTVLQFIGQMHRLTQTNEKIWKILLANCYDILDQVLALIYPDMLLQVVTGLLSSNNIPEVRRKALELLNKKLQLVDFFETGTLDTYVRLLDPLSAIVESIVDASKANKNATPTESVSLQQQALIAVKILSGHMAQTHVAEFRRLLDTLATIVKAWPDLPITLIAQSVLCVAELCANLRAHAISHLSKFMPAIDRIVQSQCAKLSANAAGPNVIMYLLSALHKIIEALPRFLSPYLVSLLTSLSTIWARLLQSAGATADNQRKLAKLQQIWTQLSGKLTLRILIPMVDQCYRRIVEAEAPLSAPAAGDRPFVSAVQPIMQLLAESLQPLPGSEINAYQADLGAFFLFALQHRCQSTAGRALIDAHEDHVIGAFVGLVLKLSETSFRPLYQRIFDWALRSAAEDGGDRAVVERAITFYRLSGRVAGALKSLFVLFSSDFIGNAAELLQKFAGVTEERRPADESAERRAQLVDAIVGTLHAIFLYDSQGFVNAHRFGLLLQPLVDLLENGEVLDSAERQTRVVDCLAQFGVASADDSAWKQLNYQILLKTRHARAQIRLLAARAAVELAKKLNDDYMPLLPETVPFLAEMLEDEDEEVEQACQRRVQELERILGEPLQKYF